MSVPHGTTGYRHHACRCDTCRTAAQAYLKEYRLTNTVATHSRAGYVNGCRCDVCRLAQNKYQREYRRQRRASA